MPIFKNASRYEPLIYPPVSLTSVCCKALERKLTKHIMITWTPTVSSPTTNLGFVQGGLRWSSFSLSSVYDHVSASIDSGRTIDLILCDYSKAFGVVCHEILLLKLQSLGIDDLLLSWISSFLTGRVMQVCVNGRLSSTRDVHSGISQGSVLGPLLFLVYINHIHRVQAIRFL